MKKVLTRVLSIVFAAILLLLNATAGFAANDFPLVDLVFTSAETLYEETDGWASNRLVGTVTVDIQEPAADIKMRSFSDCDNLTSIDINVEDASSNLTIQGASYCNSLTSVTIKSNGNITIDESAFSDCDALVNLIFDVKGTVTIKTAAFASCENLTDVDFTNIGNVVLYGEYCFPDTGFKEVNLPSNLSCDSDEDDRENGDYGYHFGGCESLEKFTADIQEIPVCLFSGCHNLKKAYLTQNVKKIEWLGFGVRHDPSTTASVYVPLPDLVVYGYTDSAAEEYCNKYGIRFLPVDTAEFSTMTLSQPSTATVGTPTSITLGVTGSPETIKLENPLGSEFTFTREDAKITTGTLSEIWTIDIIPTEEETTYTVTADYGLADLCATDEITVYAKDDNASPVISAETIAPAVIGEYAQVSVNVKGSPLAIRFVDENNNAITVNRDEAQITENNDNTETWAVNLLVNSNEQQFTVYAKNETGWLTKGTAYSLKAKVINYSTEIKDFDIKGSLDGVTYNGMNTITLTTANGVTKVQLMQNGNTWTFNENNSVVTEVDGQKYWTLKMNFYKLGDNSFDIRVRGAKTAFEFSQKLDITVYSK